MEGAPASVLAALPTAASAIISTAAGGDSSALAEQPQAAAAQPRVLALLAGSLRWVPAVQQPLLFRRLLPLVAGIPQAEDRARALAQLWSAAMAHDWAAGAGSSAGGGGGANGGRRNSTPQLQQLLLEPGVREVVSGSPASPSSATGAAGAAAAAWASLTGTGGMVAAAGSALPAFREELVGTLLYALLTHPRAARATAGGGNGAAAAASGAVAQAAALQAAQEAGEWLASAKLALLGTKACLGWDRMAGASTTGTTAAVDLWLQLLLCCLKATQVRFLLPMLSVIHPAASQAPPCPLCNGCETIAHVLLAHMPYAGHPSSRVGTQGRRRGCRRGRCHPAAAAAAAAPHAFGGGAGRGPAQGGCYGDGLAGEGDVGGLWVGVGGRTEGE